MNRLGRILLRSGYKEIMYLMYAYLGVVFLVQSVTAEQHIVTREVNPSPYESASNAINYRLPNTTHPLYYNVSLTTRLDIDIFDFYGQVRIEIVVDTTTKDIVVHARQLAVINMKLTKYVGNQTIDLDISYIYIETTEFVRIRSTKSDLEAGDRLCLEINYKSTLRTDGGGFFRVPYYDLAGKERYE